MSFIGTSLVRAWMVLTALTQAFGTVLVTGWMILSALSDVYGMDLGVVGKVYPVVEPDALAELQRRAEKINLETVLATKDNAFSAYRPKDLHTLPTARVPRAFNVDLTYTVPEDILDQHGKVVYPRGYAFNPLEVIPFPNTLIFLNGKDPLQKQWFQASPYSNNVSVMLILSDGDFLGLSKSLDRPIYYLTNSLASRLKLSAVPSVIKQRGKRLEVEEIAIKN